MILRTLILLAATTMITSGCITVPATVLYNNSEIPAVGPTGNRCKQPYLLTQDCSIFSYATRMIEIEGERGRIAGSTDGSVLLVMLEDELKLDTFELNHLSHLIEDFLTTKGLSINEMQAMAGNGETAGYFFVFNGDAYSLLKSLTVEK
jgi:hypothetical protein